jgi:DNA-binding beta-propeller fold protein YncE
MPDVPTDTVLLNRDGTAALVFESIDSRRRPPTGCEPQAAGLALRSFAGRPRHVLSPDALCAAFSADGRWGVLVDARALRPFDADDGAFAEPIDFGEGRRAQGVAISDDGSRVAVVVRGELVVFDHGRPAFRIGRQVLSERGLPVHFVAAGSAVVAVLPDLAEDDRFNLDVYDAATGSLKQRLMSHVPDGPADLAVNPTGDTVALALPDGTIRRFRVTGEAADDLEARHWLGAGFGAAANGGRMATCGQGDVEIRDTDTGAVAAHLKIPDLSCAGDDALALDPDGEHVVVEATGDRPFAARDLTGTVTATYDRPPASEAHRPVFSRSGRWLAALVTQDRRAHVFVWPAAGGAPAWDALLPPINGLSSLAVSADGGLVVASYAHVRPDGRVVGEVGALRRETADGVTWSRTQGSLAEPGHVALTPDDQRVVFASVADELVVLDAGTGAEALRGVNSADTVWTFARFGMVGVYGVLPALEQPAPRPPSHPVSALAVDPQGTMVVVAGYNRSNRLPLLEVFDLRTGELLRARGMASSPRALFFHGSALVAPGLADNGGDLATLHLGGEGI